MITNPITFSNRISILLEPIDDLVQSQTIPGIANPPGCTVIHTSREPNSTNTLVGNKFGLLDGTIHTEDTQYHSNTFTFCVGNVQSAGNKINTIADYTHEHDLDMYLIVESWLPEDEHRIKGDLKNNSY